MSTETTTTPARGQRVDSEQPILLLMLVLVVLAVVAMFAMGA